MDPSSSPLLQLTNNEANFTVVVIVATGHHGPHGVIHHGHDVDVKVLRWWKGERVTQHRKNRPKPLQGAKVSCPRDPCAPIPPAQALTPLFLMDLRSIDTTSLPSTLLHLNPFVHVTRMLCGETARGKLGGDTWLLAQGTYGPVGEPPVIGSPVALSATTSVSDKVYGHEITCELLVAPLAGGTVVPMARFDRALQQNVFTRLRNAP